MESENLRLQLLNFFFGSRKFQNNDFVFNTTKNILSSLEKNMRIIIKDILKDIKLVKR